MTSEIIFPGRKCDLLNDPGEYLYTYIEYATPWQEDDKIGAVAVFESLERGEYLSQR